MAKAPIRYFGGKGNMVSRILALIPPHHTYCEPFGGAGTVLLNKPPSPVEVFNDIDSAIVMLYRVLREPKLFERFYHKVQLTPYSREEFEYYRATWRECDDLVERAYRWYIVVRQSYGGNFSARMPSWAYSVRHSRRGMAGCCSHYLFAIESLPAFHQRLQHVQIEHDDYRAILRRYDTPNTLFYCDPPYVLETRRSGGYNHELTNDDHRELVNLLLSIQGMVILSGYRHAVYEPLEQAGWLRQDYKTACHVAGRTRVSGLQNAGALKGRQPRTESVWLSPEVQRRLGVQQNFQEV